MKTYEDFMSKPFIDWTEQEITDFINLTGTPQDIRQRHEDIKMMRKLARFERFEDDEEREESDEDRRRRKWREEQAERNRIQFGE